MIPRPVLMTTPTRGFPDLLMKPGIRFNETPSVRLCTRGHEKRYPLRFPRNRLVGHCLDGRADDHLCDVRRDTERMELGMGSFLPVCKYDSHDWEFSARPGSWSLFCPFRSSYGRWNTPNRYPEWFTPRRNDCRNRLPPLPPRSPMGRRRKLLRHPSGTGRLAIHLGVDPSHSHRVDGRFRPGPHSYQKLEEAGEPEESMEEP